MGVHILFINPASRCFDLGHFFICVSNLLKPPYWAVVNCKTRRQTAKLTSTAWSQLQKLVQTIPNCNCNCKTQCGKAHWNTMWSTIYNFLYSQLQLDCKTLDTGPIWKQTTINIMKNVAVAVSRTSTSTASTWKPLESTNSWDFFAQWIQSQNGFPVCDAQLSCWKHAENKSFDVRQTHENLAGANKPRSSMWFLWPQVPR